MRSGLAVLEAVAGRAPAAGTHAAPPVRAHVGPVAARAAGGRGASCGACGRHPPAPRRGGPDRGGRRARDRLACRQKRESGGMAVPDGTHRAARRARMRRRGRRPQGREGHVAGYADPTVPVPRAGQHPRTDRQAAPSGGRQAAAPGGPVPAPRRGRGRRGRMAGLLQPVGAGLRLVPRREERIRRRQCERHAPKARQGAAHDPQTHPGGSAVHVPRRGARVRRPGAVHEQSHRIMERAPARHAAPPPWTAAGQTAEGDLLVVPSAHGASRDRRMARGQRDAR